MTKKTEENQAFWKELEMNFLQRFQEETDSDYNFKIPLDIIDRYFTIVRGLNGSDQCLFPSNAQTSVLILLKRNFLRFQEFTEPEDIVRYINMIQSITLSKTLRYICDDQVKSRMYHFFLQNKDLLTKRDFKHWALSIYNFK